MESAILKKRSDVPLQETWDLTSFYEGWDAWEKEFANLPKEEALEAELTSQFKGRLATSPAVVLAALKKRDALQRQLGNLYVYAFLQLTQDVGDSIGANAVARVSAKSAALQSHFAFLDPELLSLVELEKWISKEAILKEYEFPLKEILREKPHILSEKEEALLSKFGVISRKFQDVFSKWNNVDLKFEPALDAQGNQHVVTNSRLGVNLESRDRVLRKNTSDSYYKEVSKWRNTIAENLLSVFQNGAINAKVRGFSGFLESSLFPDDVPVSVYDRLIEATRKNISLLHQSVELRKKILGVDKVCSYDRSVSLSHDELPKFTWQEAVSLVLASLEPLGSEVIEIAKKGMSSERWVDYAENEGKRSGAFSYGTFDSKPYFMLTWTGTLDDLFTLAHELGHSVHSHYSRNFQPYQLSNYTIFVAEVASTLFEAMLASHILRMMPGTALARQVVSQRLKNMEGTVYRQVQFAAFEREVSKVIDGEGALSADDLCKIYSDLNVEWYGPQFETSTFTTHEWMRIPHFYSTFYVYKYATSYCASLDIAARFEKKPVETRAIILEFLKTGGSKSALNTMLAAGVDFMSDATFDNAFAVYERELKAAWSLFTT
jgi:oligoendopeptidase F